VLRASAGKFIRGRIVPYRWGCTISRVMVWVPKVPP